MARSIGSVPTITLMVLVLAGCNGEANTKGAAQEARIKVHGEVGLLDPQTECDIYHEVPTLQPTGITNAQITFQDGAGNIVGVVRTSKDLALESQQSGCLFRSTYELELPRKDFYQATLTYEGDRIQAEPRSFDDLRGNGFRWDLFVDGG